MFNLIRYQKLDGAILGNLWYDSKFICSTLENESKAIPAGYYYLDYCSSPAFTKKRKTPTNLFLVYNDNVPASRGIRIHAGNTVKDSNGCILVGDAIGTKLENSRKYEDALGVLFPNETVMIITDNYRK